jgi:hypothetical protein
LSNRLWKAARLSIGIAKGRFTVPDDIDTDNEAIEKLFGGNAE